MLRRYWARIFLHGSGHPHGDPARDLRGDSRWRPWPRWTACSRSPSRCWSGGSAPSRPSAWPSSARRSPPRSIAVNAIVEGVADWNANIIEEFRANEDASAATSRAPRCCCSTRRAALGQGPRDPGRVPPSTTTTGSWSGRRAARRAIRIGYTLSTDPDVTIEVGTETIPGRVTKVRGGEEWDSLYARQVERRTGFAEYPRQDRGDPHDPRDRDRAPRGLRSLPNPQANLAPSRAAMPTQGWR